MIRRLMKQRSYWLILFGWSVVQLFVASALVRDQGVDALVVFDEILFQQGRLSKPFWYGMFFFPLLVHVIYVSPSLGTIYTEVIRFRSFGAWMVDRLVSAAVSYCLFYIIGLGIFLTFWSSHSILEVMGVLTVPMSAGIALTFLYSVLLFHMSINGAFFLTAVLPLVLVFFAEPDQPWLSYLLMGASEGYVLKMGILWLVNACLLGYAAAGSVTTYVLKRGDQA